MGMNEANESREIPAVDEWRHVDMMTVPDDEWAWVIKTIPHASYNLRRLIWWAVHRKKWIVRQANQYSVTMAQWDSAEQAIVVIQIGIDYSGRPRGASRYVENPTHQPRTMDEIAGLL
jgi:hypothetical protein